MVTIGFRRRLEEKYMLGTWVAISELTVEHMYIDRNKGGTGKKTFITPCVNPFIPRYPVPNVQQPGYILSQKPLHILQYLYHTFCPT